MDMGLDGKIAWVTGATGAIGREVCLSLAREGASVVVSARTPEAVDALVNEIQSSGGSARGIPLDVTDRAAVQSAASRIVDHHGQLDILVSTVAVPAFGPFLEIDPEVFRAALEVKYLGYVNAIQAALPHMEAAGQGAIVAVTGTGGKLPIAIHLPGGSVNAALNLLLKGLANEFGPRNIRVNAVSPGPIMSERQTKMVEAGMGDLAKGIPLGRLGEAEEVADAVTFLASERAIYITGQVLQLDGGTVLSL